MIVIVGATTWGTILAVAFSRRNEPVGLLTRTEDEANQLRTIGEHVRRLPGVRLPESLVISGDPALLQNASIVIFSTPSQTMRENVRKVRDAIPAAAIVLSAAKGIEITTTARMTQVMADELPGHDAIGALSGPNLGREVAAGLPAATVVALRDAGLAARARDQLIAPYFRVYSNTDVVGVELGGALKNVIALAAGICDGLGMGDNARAGLITRGLAEISRLGVAAGAHAQTFAGLAGLGDLVASCSSKLSRNHQVGESLAKGETLAGILARLGQVAEGVTTTEAALRLAANLGVDLPVTQTMANVLFHGMHPAEGAKALLGRVARQEFP